MKTKLAPVILIVVAIALIGASGGPKPPEPVSTPIADLSVSSEYGFGIDFSGSPLAAGGVRADTMLAGNAAALGDLVWISFAADSNWPAVPDGMIVQAWVEAPGRVRIVFINATGATVHSMVFTHFRIVHGTP